MPKRTRGASLVVRLLRLYQRRLSPRFEGACLYTPSCSQYAVEAVEKHGPVQGIRLSASRLMRCRAPYTGGDDPVP